MNIMLENLNLDLNQLDEDLDINITLNESDVKEPHLLQLIEDIKLESTGKKTKYYNLNF